MKKLVYINQVGNYLSEGIVRAMLSDGGYDEVTLLLGNPGNVRIDLPNVRIEKICSYNRSSFLKRTCSWIVASLQIQWNLWTRYRHYDVFLVSNPPIAAFCMALTCNKYKSLIYDIYPDGLVSGGFLSDRNPFIRLWQRYNRRFFKNADGVFTITEGMADRLSKYIDRSKIEVVPIWYNPSLRRIPKEENLFIREHKLEDKFIVMYSGNIGKTHNVELLVDVANLLKDERDIMFVIIGEGWSKQNIVSKVDELNLPNVIILPYQPVDFISHSLSAASISYISLDEKVSTVSVPSKTYNCMFVGSPLLCIASEKAELTRLVNKNNTGAVFHEKDPEKIASFVRELKNGGAKYAAMRRNAITASEKFSSDNAFKFCKIK